jgi:hypothetical protein
MAIFELTTELATFLAQSESLPWSAFQGQLRIRRKLRDASPLF